MDHQLPRHSLGREAADALRARILKIAPRHLAFTSLTAGRAVMGKNAVPGKQQEKIGETIVWILPSPSPLADNHWDIAPVARPGAGGQARRLGNPDRNSMRGARDQRGGRAAQLTHCWPGSLASHCADGARRAKLT